MTNDSFVNVIRRYFSVFRQHDWGTTIYAADELATMGKEAVSIFYFNRGALEVVSKAVQALGQLGDARAVPALTWLQIITRIDYLPII